MGSCISVFMSYGIVAADPGNTPAHACSYVFIALTLVDHNLAGEILAGDRR